MQALGRRETMDFNCVSAARSAPAPRADGDAQRAAAQAKAEAKAAEEREAAKQKAKKPNDEAVPKGFKPEAASASLAALLSSTIAAI
jgi:hypothetical protein